MSIQAKLPCNKCPIPGPPGKEGRPGDQGPQGPTTIGPQGPEGAPGADGDIQIEHTVFVDLKFGDESTSRVESRPFQAPSLLNALQLIIATGDPGPWLLVFAPGDYVIPEGVQLGPGIFIKGTGNAGSTRLLGSLAYGDVTILPPSPPASAQKAKKHNQKIKSLATTVSASNGIYDIELHRRYDIPVSSAEYVAPILITSTYGVDNVLELVNVQLDIIYSIPETERDDQGRRFQQCIVQIENGQVRSRKCVYQLNTIETGTAEGLSATVDCIYSNRWTIPEETDSQALFASQGDYFFIRTHDRYDLEDDAAQVSLLHFYQMEQFNPGTGRQNIANVDGGRISIEFVRQSEEPPSVRTALIAFNELPPPFQQIQVQRHATITRSALSWFGNATLNAENGLVQLLLVWTSENILAQNVSANISQLRTAFGIGNDNRILDKIFLYNVHEEETNNPTISILDSSFIRTSNMVNVSADNATPEPDASAENEIQPGILGWTESTAETSISGPGLVPQRQRYRTTNTSGTVNTSAGLATNMVRHQVGMVAPEATERYKASDQDGTILVDLLPLEEPRLGTTVIYLPLANKYLGETASVLPGRIIVVRRLNDEAPGDSVVVRVLDSPNPNAQNQINGQVATDAVPAGQIVLEPGKSVIFQAGGQNDWYTIAETCYDVVSLPAVASYQDWIGTELPEPGLRTDVQPVFQSGEPIYIGPSRSISTHYLILRAVDPLLPADAETLAFGATATSLSLGASTRRALFRQAVFRVGVLSQVTTPNGWPNSGSTTAQNGVDGTPVLTLEIFHQAFTGGPRTSIATGSVDLDVSVPPNLDEEVYNVRVNPTDPMASYADGDLFAVRLTVTNVDVAQFNAVNGGMSFERL
jgi:hypothetical protein